MAGKVFFYDTNDDFNDVSASRRFPDCPLTHEDNSEDRDKGVFEQGDGSPPNSHVEDESLPPLLRIQKYAQSENRNDRRMVWSLLTELFKSGPEESMTTYLPQIMNTVVKLAEESEYSILKEFLKQAPNVGAIAKECSSRIPSLETVSSGYLLPMVVRHLGTNHDVWRCSQTALFSMINMELVSLRDVEVKVCPAVLALSRDRDADCHRCTITWMSKLATLLGKDVTERVFLDRFVQLCADQDVSVRRVCAFQFGNFCSVVGKNAYEKILLPAFIELCKDNEWGVRKACAEVAISVSCVCPPEIRRSSLAPIFVKLLEDSSRWVRMSAFQTLGPFISTFAESGGSTPFYNLGELMLLNPDGREFRVKSTSQRRQFEMHNSFIGKNAFGFNLLNDPYEDFDVTIDIPPMSEEDDSGSNIVVEPPPIDPGPPVVSSVSVISDKKHEDVIIQKNFNVVSKAMFGEVIADDVFSEGVTEIEVVESSGTVKEDSEDIKEIVETVKNAVLSFRSDCNKAEEGTFDNKEGSFGNKDGSFGDTDGLFDKDGAFGDKDGLFNKDGLLNNDGLFDKNGIFDDKDGWIESKVNDDVFGDFGGDLRLEGVDLNVKKDFIQKKKVDDGDLRQFNSYNYWYISPEMPVDLSIVEEKQSTSNGGCDSTSHYTAQTDHLTSLFSSIRLDETINLNETSMVDETFVTLEGDSFNNTTQLTTSQLQQEEDDDNKNLNEKPVPKILVYHFMSMTDPSLARNTDDEMAFHCAYSLPAVALTIGSENFHVIKDTVEDLASDVQYKVRRTVASSLHELALILGPELTSNYLVPIFEGFIKDLDEVRIGVLKHLAEFLKLLNPTTRAVYLPRLTEFLQADNELNWRFRQELAEQLRLSLPLFKAVDVAKHIVYIATILLSDKVAVVRDSALELVSELLKHVSTEKDFTHRILIILAERFAHSKKWKRRQTFTLLCCKFLDNESVPLEVFATDVMPHLLDLSWDPVPNVRLVVARTIAKNMITHPFFSDPSNQYNEGLETVMRRLQADKDRDVRHSALIENFNTNIPEIH